jgi:hypothetical protein
VAQRTTIDITNIPELRHVAGEARETGKPIVLQVDGEDMAIVQPLGRPQSDLDFKPTEEQIRITVSTFGRLKGLIDPDELKAQIREARGSDRSIPGLPSISD